MREIKFRAWDEELERWSHFTFDALIIGAATRKPLAHWSQFTGLKDKNGTEIYESDIVKSERYVHEVRFGTECIDASYYEPYCEETTGFYLTNHFGDKDLYEGLGNGKELEIIGNTYENPELLEQ